jgi:hypothetical protein
MLTSFRAARRSFVSRLTAGAVDFWYGHFHRRSRPRVSRRPLRAPATLRWAIVERLEARALLTTVVNVDTIDDVVDSGDGVTSLREAIIQANSTAGDFEIRLGAITYSLRLAGVFEDAAETGDLDILDNGRITILGAGAGQTIIDASGLATASSLSSPAPC